MQLQTVINVAILTLEHAMLDCPTVDNFWNEIQAYVDRITNKMLTLIIQIKLFGKVKRKK